jgi:hypothetical protein
VIQQIAASTSSTPVLTTVVDAYALSVAIFPEPVEARHPATFPHCSCHSCQ